MARPTTTPPLHGDGHAPAASMQAMSSSLFWGDRAVVLFPGWPGARGLGSYLLSLLFVLALAALAEALHAVSAHVAHRWRRRGAVVPALLLTAVHAARMGAAYLLMLAVMSYNGGVLLAAVAGHALGFLLTRSWASRAEEMEAGHGAGAGAGRGRDRVIPPSDDAAKA
ncbi:copper transporter 6-like [Miscanthus floridulus]|uniref:copper transporter 6-like n=1 Tax=Miscanthus floridulus TaxID=154761 RepID=UPI003458B69A